MDSKLRMPPSSADRWSNCPASVSLSIGAPYKPTIYAAEGTVAHWVLAECLTLMLPPESFLGTIKEQDGFKVEVDEEMVEGVTEAIEHIEEMLSSIPGSELFVELKKTIPGLPINGYIDVLIAAPDRMIVIDFKYGRGVMVPVERNPQIMTYGATLLPDYPDADEWSFYVIQPRARTGPKAKSWQTDRATIQSWRDSLGTTAKRIEEAHAAVKGGKDLRPYMAEGSHCQFCPAKPECPLLTGFATAAVDVPVSEVRTWGAAECKEWLDRIEVLSGWIDAVKGRAFQLLEQGEPIAGWKLVDSIGNRRWTDTAVVVDKLRDVGFSRKALVEEVLLSPAKVEKLKLPRKLSKDVRDKLIADLTKRPVTGRSMVRDSDSRDPLPLDAVEKDFEVPPDLEGIL